MRDGMNKTEERNRHADQFMHVNILVERQNRVHFSRPQPGDGVPKHQDNDKRTIKVQTHPTSTSYDRPDVQVGIT